MRILLTGFQSVMQICKIQYALSEYQTHTPTRGDDSSSCSSIRDDFEFDGGFAARGHGRGRGRGRGHRVVASVAASPDLAEEARQPLPAEAAEAAPEAPVAVAVGETSNCPNGRSSAITTRFHNAQDPD
jgi:ketosteroid isomerase-like protein